MKISVVTSVYNAAATIEDTLRSVASQTHLDREHVVADGGSTDGTLEILRRYSGGLGRLESRRDAGIYDGLNNGLALATGDVIGFLHSDDVYEDPRVLESVAEAFERTGADIVFGDVVYVQAQDLSQVVRFYSSAGFEPRDMARGIIPAHPAKFVRRWVFERYGNFDPSYRTAGDFAWDARVLGQPGIKLAYLPKVLVRMRYGGASTPGPINTLRVTREIKRACDEAGIETSYLRLFSRIPAKLIEYLRRPTSRGPDGVQGPGAG